MHPVDLSEYAPYAIPLHGVLDAAARRKADLQRNIVIELRTWNDPIYDSHAPGGNRVHVRPAPVEQRPDEPALLQAVGAWERGARRGVVPISGQRSHRL